MQSVEHFRDIILELQEENASLRMIARNSKLLFSGVQRLLSLEAESDPFLAAFESLHLVFEFECGFALLESGDRLECIATSCNDLLHTECRRSRMLERVLAGRAVATASGHGLDFIGDNILGPDRACPALFLPLRMTENRGAIVLLRAAGAEGFSRDDVSLAQNYALLASAALKVRSQTLKEHENVRLQELTRELEYRAYHDTLTGLGNRAQIERMTSRKLADKDPQTLIALAFIDVDRFKRINDYFGHEIGDRLLVEIATRLGPVTAPQDCLSRISGDEFVIILDGVKDRTELDARVRAIRDALSHPYLIDELRIDVTVSIGVSVYPSDGKNYEDLQRNADFAMYRSKAARKGAPVMFSKEMGRDTSDPMELELRLRDAIEKDAFDCAFQPKINLSDNKVVGFEALARWKDADQMIRQPNDFIPLATELGLLNEITHSVIDHACKALVQLDKGFGDNTTMSVNIAAQQASDPEFMSDLIAEILMSGYADRMIFELTEDAIVHAPRFKATIQPLLTKAGIRLSIDDFGTGYSSLSALANIEASELKIDRAFISHIHLNPINQRILRAIDQMAHAVGMETVAEGVESFDELCYLCQSTTVSVVQGYYFSKPQFLADLMRWKAESAA